MSEFSLNESMIRLAKQKAEQMASDLQVNAVVVIIAHSNSEIAVGYAHDIKESPASVGQIINDVAQDFKDKP